MATKNNDFNLSDEEIEAEYERFMKIPESDHEPSPRFRRRLARITHRRLIGIKLTFPFGLRKAVALVTVICVMLLVPFVVRAVYGIVASFELKYGDGKADFEIVVPDDINPPKNLERLYCLGTLPEGYEYDNSNFDAISNINYYKCSGTVDEGIVFTQAILSGNFTVSIEDVEYKEVYYGEYKALYRYGDEYSSLNWITNEYYFSIVVYENYSLENLIELAEGIIEQNK